jgi:adenine phosphoribosyltransferase
MDMDLKEKICEVKDFPKPGVGFKDITPLIEDAASFNYVIDSIASWAKARKPQIVIGIESRGFVFAAAVARELHLGMSMIRKLGKLPRKTVKVRAPNEYAVEYFEMHTDSIRSSQRALIVDDLIATGSSSISAIDLIKKLKGKVIGFAAVVELSFLKGVEKIKKAHPDVDIFTLVQYKE